jgi:hypothetical protein
VLEDGSKLRLYPCNRFSIFQKFAWSGTEGRLKLKVLSHDDLCVTYRAGSNSFQEMFRNPDSPNKMEGSSSQRGSSYSINYSRRLVCPSASSTQ